MTIENKKHLKNVGRPIRYCEPPLHCQSPVVASRTPAIAIAQAAAMSTTTTTTTTRDRGDRYGLMEWAQQIAAASTSPTNGQHNEQFLPKPMLYWPA